MEYYIAPSQWGTPTDGGEFSYDVFQGNQPACAVYSQYNVLKDYGFTGTAEDLVAEATEEGWYDPKSGTSLENIGKLLESHGVPCDMYVNANRYNLLGELAQGKKVIVTVDSSELWKDGKLSRLGEMLKDVLPIDGSDHALVVSGFNTEDPNHAMITLTDSGSGQAAVSYPIEQFEDAWRDGHCTMIVPREAPPAEMNLPSMAHLESVEEYLPVNMAQDNGVIPLSDFEIFDPMATDDDLCASRQHHDSRDDFDVNHLLESSVMEETDASFAVDDTIDDSSGNEERLSEDGSFFDVATDIVE